MSKKNKDEITIRSSAAEYLTYVASVGGEDTSMEMRYEHENIWLTQKMMAVLYDVTISTINEHIMKIYADGELTEEATIRNFRIVQTEGSRDVNRNVMHFSSDAFMFEVAMAISIVAIFLLAMIVKNSLRKLSIWNDYMNVAIEELEQKYKKNK